MKKVFKLQCLAMCIIMLFTMSGFTISENEQYQENYTISEAYSYPIVPDTDEWRAFTTHAQMVTAC